VDKVDELRLRVLHAAAEEVRAFDELAGALLELGQATLVTVAERRLLVEYVDAAAEFAAKRRAVLDLLVEPYVRQAHEGML
jgi:hypothetical protein